MIPQNIPLDNERVFINVYSHKAFNECMESHGWLHDAGNVPDDIACISIGCTPDIQKNYLEEHKHEYDKHWFNRDSRNVINLDFDDIAEETKETKYGTAYGITTEQAVRLVKFIQDNLDTVKHWYIHCRSGKSRSVAVGSFISDIFVDTKRPAILYLPHGDANLNQFVMQKLQNVYKELKI